jgi:hypothetical protein
MHQHTSGSGDGVRKLGRGFTAFGVFLFLGAAMASLAGTTLLWRGTGLDRIWRLNPRGWQQLAPLGNAAGIFFVLLAAVLALAGLGWSRRRAWGWRLGVAILATQVLGDLVNLLRGELLRGGIGFVIAGALLIYLLRPGIRGCFEASRSTKP